LVRGRTRKRGSQARPAQQVGRWQSTCRSWGAANQMMPVIGCCCWLGRINLWCAHSPLLTMLLVSVPTNYGSACCSVTLLCPTYALVFASMRGYTIVVSSSPALLYSGRTPSTATISGLTAHQCHATPGFCKRMSGATHWQSWVCMCSVQGQTGMKQRHMGQRAAHWC